MNRNNNNRLPCFNQLAKLTLGSSLGLLLNAPLALAFPGSPQLLSCEVEGEYASSFIIEIDKEFESASLKFTGDFRYPDILDGGFNQTETGFEVWSRTEPTDWSLPEFEEECFVATFSTSAKLNLTPETGGEYEGTYLSSYKLEWNPKRPENCRIPMPPRPTELTFSCGRIVALP